MSNKCVYIYMYMYIYIYIHVYKIHIFAEFICIFTCLCYTVSYIRLIKYALHMLLIYIIESYILMHST